MLATNVLTNIFSISKQPNLGYLFVETLVFRTFKVLPLFSWCNKGSWRVESNKWPSDGIKWWGNGGSRVSCYANI